MHFCLARVCALLLLVPTYVGANAQMSEPQVNGHVVRSDNGMPIEGATVQLELAHAFSSNGVFHTAITDKNGEYHFSEMRSEAYLVRASADGFVWQTYTVDGTIQGQVMQIDATAHLRGIDFRLQREAVIRGMLTGARGDSVGAGVFLAAVRQPEAEPATARMRVVDTVKTDASGRFLFTKLEPGTYFVCVNGPNGMNAFPDAGGWYRETWYEHGSSAKNATALILKEGEERDGIRIEVEREQRYNVMVWPSGPEGQPNPDHYSVRIIGRSHRSSHQPDGSYLIPGIPAGRYRLESVAWSGSEYQGAGDTTFEITNSDVTVHLKVGGLGAIEGVVGASDGSANIPAGVMIGIKSGGAAQGKDVDAAGHFVFGRVLPGHYQFELLKNPAGVVLRSVNCHGAKVAPDSPLPMGDREKVTDCEVVLGTDASEPARP